MRQRNRAFLRLTLSRVMEANPGWTVYGPGKEEEEVL